MSTAWWIATGIVAFIIVSGVRKVVGDEFRARLDRFPALMVHLAAWALPADIRDTHRREWEDDLLAALTDQTEDLPITRFFRGLALGFMLMARVRIIRAELGVGSGGLLAVWAKRHPGYGYGLAAASAVVGTVAVMMPLTTQPLAETIGTSEGTIAAQAALTRIGDPYSWGAAGPSAFDSSGLVMWAFQQAGISLPHSSQELARGGTPVSRDQLQPGDVVNFYSDASHTGIYIGNGMVVHASTYGMPVKAVPLGSAGPFYNARRY